jgi:hypothetical protein
MSEVSRHKSAYEHSDVSGTLLVLLSAGLAFFLLATPGMLAFLYPRAVHQADVGPVPSPPGPHLQVDPAADLTALRGAEDAQLSSYGWVDRAAGAIRIPINRALALTAERGLPDWRKP